ncbi:MAG TPA: ABC transporter permease [Bacteroidales bacterium]|nr:ABC transporter permease [Bacteroidales bacterium]
MFLTKALKISFRNFRHNMKITLIKVAGLTISIAAIMIIWAYIMRENSYDKGLENSGNVYRLDAHWASMPPVIGHAISQDMNDLAVTRMNFSTDVGVQVDNNPFNLPDLMFADSTFFRVIPFRFIEGNPATALVTPFSIVLTESVAVKLFGTNRVTGRVIKMENEVDFTVTGVIKDNPFLHLKIEAIASIVTLEEIVSPGVLKAYDGWSYPTYLAIPDNTNAIVYEKRINDLLHKMHYDQVFHLTPFESIYYSSEMENESNTKHGNITYNNILIAVSIFILLLAAVNFINLTIAGALSRSKEVSLRKLQGASISNLVIQFLIETALYVSISVVVAFLIIWFINPALKSITGFSVIYSEFLRKNNPVILIAGFLTFIFLAGIYPSIHISLFSVNFMKSRRYGRSRIVRNGLIIFQNVISITLISCTLIANSQFQFMNRKDLGFSKENVVILKLNSQLKEHTDLFRGKLSSLPEIAGITYSSRIPGNYWGSWCCVKIEGEENKYFNNYIDPFYLTTLGIKIKEGRNFSASDAADLKTTYLINETAIKAYNLKDPIGQVITPGNGMTGTIIGIVNDFHYRGLQYEKTPVLFFNTDQYKNYVNIRIAGNDMNTAIKRIKEAWREVCPAFSFDYKMLDETYDLQYNSERRFEGLIFFFALLAIFIAGIGLLGISIFSSERRIKEIGIRKVNGAGTAEIVSMLNSDVLPWILVSFIIACPISLYAMNIWLQSFAYKTTISIWIFAVSCIISVSLATLTISIQTWKTASGNPVKALRYE